MVSKSCKQLFVIWGIIYEHSDTPQVIYSDSITAVTWYCNRRMASSQRLPVLLKAETFLKAMDGKIKNIRVEYRDNKLWSAPSRPVSVTNSNQGIAKQKSQLRKYIEPRKRIIPVSLKTHKD